MTFSSLADRLRLLVTGACVIVGGCSGERQRMEASLADAATLNDMVAAAPRLRLVEDLRLDADAEDFSTVTRLHVGPRGEIVVPLPQDQQVRIYDAAGVHMATVGRRGAGPGEFLGISTMGWVADTLWIFDIRQQRVTFVGPDGAVLRTTAPLRDRTLVDASADTAVASLGMFTVLASYPDGSFLTDARPLLPGGRGVGPRLLAFAPPDGGASLIMHPPSFEDLRWMLDVAGFGQRVPFTMTPQMSWSIDGTRLAMLHAESLSDDGGLLSLALFRWSAPWRTLARVDAPPEPTLALAIPYRGETIPRHAVDSALATFIPAQGQPREGPADLPRRFQDQARERMPAVYAPVSGMRLGLDDTIWLDLRPTEAGRVSLILDGSGRPVGTVVVPPNVTIRQSSAQWIWATERDEYGLSSVVRYTLR